MPAPVKTISDFVVPLTNQNSDRGSSVTALVNGGFVLSYSQPVAFNPSDIDTILVRFSPQADAGGQIGPTSAATPSERDVGLGALIDGRYAAVAVRNNDVVLRIYELANPFSSGVTEVVAGSVTATAQAEFRPMVAGLASGQIAVAWFSGTDLLYRQFSVAGMPTTSTTTLSSTSSQPTAFRGDVAVLSTGALVVVWNDAAGASFRLITPAVPGATTEPILSGAITAVQGAGVLRPSITATSDGGFAIAAAQTNTQGSTIDPLVNFYRSDGTLRASVSVPGQSGVDAPVMRVAALSDGRVMIVWSASNGTGDVWGQVLSADGVLDGAAFRVNNDTTGEAYDPSIAVMADGRVVVSWTSTATGGGDVYAAVYDPREAGVFLTGTALGDSFQGSAFGDALFGGLGADSLRGGGGGDTLAGEAGDDTLNGEAGGDFLYGGAGRDFLIGDEGADFLLGEGGADEAFGGSAADVLLGGDGADFLYGDSGDDGLYGENGDDTLFGGSEIDTLFGGAGNDLLYGGEGGDTIRGETGDDSVLAGSGDDLILGGDGADSLTGEDGADTIYGEIGDDDLRGFAGNDILLGGDGNDLLDGSFDNDQLYGENGADRLIGGSQNDLLQGGAGADTLSGGSGADILHGGFGDDSYSGGLDADTFVFVRSEMNNGDVDSVLGWIPEEDSIQLFGFTPSQVSTAVVGMDVLVLVSLADGGSATIWFRGTTDNAAVFNDIQFI